MAFSFSLKLGKVLTFLQSLSSEFQVLAPLYAKLFCPNFVFIYGGLRSKLELRSIPGAQLGILEGRGPGDKKGTIRNFV